MSTPLILVTNFDGLMADGRRVAWQSFRPAKAAAGSKPTVYTTTLGAYPDALGITTYNLRTAGAQAANYAVKLTVLEGRAELQLPGQAPVKLKPDVAVTIPARGTGDAAELKFASGFCSVKVEPIWPKTTTTLAAESADTLLRTDSGTTEAAGDDGSGGDPPPPPMPGGVEDR